MQTSSFGGAVLVVVCLFSACTDDAPHGDGAGPTTPPGSPTGSTTAGSSPEESLLEGTWTTDLTREAVVAYVRAVGWGAKAEKLLLDPDLAGPEQTEFRVDFVGDRFRMSQAATDEQWQSGTWRIEGDRIYLDDEAPVGELTFRLELDGDTATFDQSDDTGDPGEFIDDVPGWAPGAVLWGATAWVRAD